MNIVTDLVRRDREYGELFSTVLANFAASKPFPVAASGLSDGASDAVYASLLCDLAKKGKGE